MDRGQAARLAGMDPADAPGLLRAFPIGRYRSYFSLESLARLVDTDPLKLPAVAA